MIQKRVNCYCAFCKNPRKVYASKHLNFMALVSLIVLSYVLTQVIWGEPDARGLAIMAALLVLGEGFAQVRWRSSMNCKNCGFDPVLYIKDQAKAGEKIKAFMQMRSEKPEFLLKPTIKVNRRRASASSLTNANAVAQTAEKALQKASQKGRNLSLQG